MAQFRVNILAKARIKFAGNKDKDFSRIKIITTCGTADGEVITDRRDIGNFSYCGYEEFWEYNIDTFQPYSVEEFEVIDEKGNKEECAQYEIDEIIEIFEDDVEELIGI